MKAKRFMNVLFVLMGIVAICSWGVADVIAAQTFTWRMSSAFAPGDLSAELLPEFAKRVDAGSKGRLKIRTFYAGDVVPGGEVLDAVSKGMIEMAVLSGGSFLGKYPGLCAHATTPFMLTGSFEKVTNFALKGEMAKIINDTYGSLGLHVLGYVPFGPYPALCSRVPIRSMEDFKGKKIRASGLATQLFNAIGASAGFIPGGEVYLALQLGTYDAAVYSVDAIDGMKWREVMKYFILPYFTDEYFGANLVNKAAWDKLPEDLKQVLREAQQWYFDKNHTEIDKIRKMVVDRSKEWGYEVITLPPSEYEKIKKVAIEKVWPQVAKDPASTRVLELVKKWHGVQ